MVERALNEGMEVWAAVRRNSSRKYLTDERIRFIELFLGLSGELTRELTAHAETEGTFDYVIHAAGATKCRKPADFFAVNAEGTVRLALKIIDTGDQRQQGRFVVICAPRVFGPACETKRRPIHESDPKVPDTAYGRSKLEAESRLAEIPGLNYVVLRPTGV